MRTTVLSLLALASLILVSLASAAEEPLAPEGPPVLFDTERYQATVIAMPDGDVVVGYGDANPILQRFTTAGVPTAPPSLMQGGGYALGKLSMTVDEEGQIVAVMRVGSPVAVVCPGFVSRYVLFDSDLNPLTSAETFGQGYGDCQAPPVAGGPGGVFSFAFHSQNELFLQRFDRDGFPVNDPQPVADEVVWNYSVARSRDGEAAVVWTRANPVESRMILENAEGDRIPAPDVSSFGILPKVIGHPSGGFWGFSVTNTEPESTLNAWRTTSSGAQHLTEMATLSPTLEPGMPPWEYFLDAVTDDLGNTLVVWKDPGDDVIAPSLKARVLDPRGRLLGDAIEVDDSLVAEAFSTSIAALGRGRFFVLWVTLDRDVYGRVLTLDLSPCSGPSSFCREELRSLPPASKDPFGGGASLPASSLRARPLPRSLGRSFRPSEREGQPTDRRA